MNQIVDQAIVLKRQEFGEADRIVTFLTKSNGKITGMVKGARRSKSKMAGGIELFSQSSVTFMVGKGEMRTIISTRLETHYGNIAKDVTRTMWAYEALKLLDKSTEEDCGPNFFELSQDLFEALNDNAISLNAVRLWFFVNLLAELGHSINTKTDDENKKLMPEGEFDFSFSSMSFVSNPNGQFGIDHIKLLRLAVSHKPATLFRVNGVNELVQRLLPVVEQATKLSAH